MTGQANCRGLKHRAAQGFEHPTQVLSVPREPPLPAHSAWAGVEVCLTAVLGVPKVSPPRPPVTPNSWPSHTQCASDSALAASPQRPSPKLRGCAALRQPLKEAEMCAGGVSGWRCCTGRSHVGPRTKAVDQSLDQNGGSRPTLSSSFGPRRDPPILDREAGSRGQPVCGQVRVPSMGWSVGCEGREAGPALARY